MKLRTGNRRRLKAHRRQMLREAFDFDLRQLARMTASDTLHKRRDTHYVRKHRIKPSSVVRWAMCA